jgi:hypothetical protein
MDRRPHTERDADRQWQTLWRDVPRRAPSVAFSIRLMAATRPEWPRPAAGLRTEFAVTAGVIAAAAALTLAPVALVAALFFVDTGVIVGGIARACVWVVNWFSAGVSVWDVLGRLGRVAARAMTSSTGTVVLISGVLTAWLALAGLTRVLPAERRDL